jgi:hypothetical protein
MPNRNKQKGDRWEAAVTGAYRALGFPHAERTRAGWDDDRGDHLLAPGLCVQSKDCATARWGEWFVQLEEQRVNAGAEHAWLVVKRRGVGDAAQGLAVMTVEAHARLLRAAGYGDPPAEERAS